MEFTQTLVRLSRSYIIRGMKIASSVIVFTIKIPFVTFTETSVYFSVT